MRRRTVIAGIGAARRRAFIALCVASLLVAPAQAEDRSRPARVGVIAQGTAADDTTVGLRRELADRGYVEGRDLVLEERYAVGDAARFSTLIAELLALPVDVLVAQGTPASLAAKHQTTTVPIVIQSGDPVGAGLIASLSHPGGNLTGTSLLSSDFSAKWLELLKEAVPALHRVAVLWNPDNAVNAREVDGMRAAAPSLGLELVALPARPQEIEASLAAIAGSRSDGLVLAVDAFILSQSSQIVDFAAEHRLPTIAGFSNYTKQGGLMSYSVDFVAVGRRTGRYVDRILKGAMPADLPVEQASEFTLRLNLKTAAALGLAVPPAILARADEVTE
jgi:putative tryptophan/tyrosine transport system substrate-binding protein